MLDGVCKACFTPLSQAESPIGETEIMPFDSAPQVETKPDLSKPSLEALSWLLRHKEHWPVGFQWKWLEIDNCASGLSDHVWGACPLRKGDDTLRLAQNGRRFHIGKRGAERIFFGAGDYGDDHHDEIGPEMVADAIDRYLAQRGAS